MTEQQFLAETRVVVRSIHPAMGVIVEDCIRCGKPVSFRARVRQHKVIANVYEDGKWVRVDQWHLQCYVDAGSPHGRVDDPADGS